MKESGGPTSSTYVSQKQRRKRFSTDFTDRRARKRKASSRKVDTKRNLLRAPLKVRGAGLPLAQIFCSIRKLILESIVEIKDEVLEDTIVEPQEQELIGSVEKQKEMMEAQGFYTSQTLETPQPSFGFKDSSARETDSQSGGHSHLEVVSSCFIVLRLSIYGYFYGKTL